jgi:hypothetical protein
MITNRRRYASKHALTFGSIPEINYRRQFSCTDPFGEDLNGNNGPYAKYAGTLEYMDDVITPNYRRLSAEGHVFMNPMHRVKSVMPETNTSDVNLTHVPPSCAGQPGEYHSERRYRAQGWGFNLYAGWMDFISSPVDVQQPPWLFSSEELSGIVKEATTSCLAKRGQSAKSNLWESVAEAHKSVGLIRDLLGQAERITRNRSLIAKSKALGSAYLLLRYGLGPIMNDIASIQKGLKEKVGTVRVSTRGNASASRQNTTSRVNIYSIFFTFTVNNIFAERVSVRALSLDELVADVASNIGFSTKGLITLPWELIPYSFVVDWFANVGDYLNAITPLFNVKQLGSCVVVERNWEVRTFFGDTQPQNPSEYTVSTPLSGGMQWTYTDKTRYPDIGGPSLVIKSDFRFNEVTRFADAISLILQRLG